jgi:hypothetical protein
MISRFVTFPLIAIAFGCIAFAQTPAIVLQADPPISAAVRLHWLARQNLSPAALLENVALGAEETLTNSPREYGPHWEGYGKRVGMITANYGVKTVMEAGLGSIWGEDPRYNRTEGQPFGSRLGHVVKMTFLARNRAGNTMPAYARFLAIPGSSFLENEWMPDSEATVNQAAVRTGLGFLSRMAENAYKEFRPRH